MINTKLGLKPKLTKDAGAADQPEAAEEEVVNR